MKRKPMPDWVIKQIRAVRALAIWMVYREERWPNWWSPHKGSADLRQAIADLSKVLP
jgi:hypothetical protein